MPSTGQKGARSRLADVLADIKNSRGEDDVSGTRPTPAKRRFTLNYAALNSQTPRQSRSSTTNSSGGHPTTKVHNTSSPSRGKTYSLKFVDNSVDLSQFLQAAKKCGSTKEQPLYPIVRAWIQNKDPASIPDPDNPTVDSSSGGGAEQADDERRRQTSTAATECEQTATIDTSSERSGATEKRIERKQTRNADEICSFLRERKRKKDLDC